jgi:hypothetical protein
MASKRYCGLAVVEKIIHKSRVSSGIAAHCSHILWGFTSIGLL